MRNVIAILGILLSTSAFAAGTKGTNGNFRRAEVVRAAGVHKGEVTSVRSATNTAHFNPNPNLPKSSRVELVEHYSSNNHEREVAIVKAPLDKSQPVERMNTAQAHRAGLITQPEARALASRNRSLLGTPGKVQLRDDGVSSRGSYLFRQTKPSTIKVKEYGSTYKVGGITRSVTVTGSAESAKTHSMEVVK